MGFWFGRRRDFPSANRQRCINPRSQRHLAHHDFLHRITHPRRQLNFVDKNIKCQMSRLITEKKLRKKRKRKKASIFRQAPTCHTWFMHRRSVEWHRMIKSTTNVRCHQWWNHLATEAPFVGIGWVTDWVRECHSAHWWSHTVPFLPELSREEDIFHN